MVEHAAVNRVVVGSSPTSGANFIGVFAKNDLPDTLPTQKTPEFDAADVKKWPKQIKHRNKVLAKIYRPGKGRTSYRVAWQAGGKRLMKSFATYSGDGGAKKFADDLVPSLARGSQATLLSPKQAQDAFHIQDMLHAYQQESGRRISVVEAVSTCIAASRLLPATASLVEAARVYAKQLGSVKPKTIAEAVTDFIQFRKGKDAKPGERARFSPVYARNVESWLTKFSATFSGHLVSDLTPDLLELYLAKYSELSEKARNDRRVTIGMWLRWCGRKEFIDSQQLARLLACDAMRAELLQDGKIAFYTAAELRKILDATKDDKFETEAATKDALCAVTALGAFGGARVQEAVRLRWEDLYRSPGHIEISGEHAKTRKRRLLEVGPALAAWLAPFKDRTGPIWDAPFNSFITEWARLRDYVQVPSKRNGVRHGFVSYSYILRGEIETSALAGTSPQILHSNYRGLATKQEALAWFAVKPVKAENGEDHSQVEGAEA